MRNSDLLADMPPADLFVIEDTDKMGGKGPPDGVLSAVVRENPCVVVYSAIGAEGVLDPVF